MGGCRHLLRPALHKFLVVEIPDLPCNHLDLVVRHDGRDAENGDIGTFDGNSADDEINILKIPVFQFIKGQDLDNADIAQIVLERHRQQIRRAGTVAADQQNRQLSCTAHLLALRSRPDVYGQITDLIL